MHPHLRTTLRPVDTDVLLGGWAVFGSFVVVAVHTCLWLSALSLVTGWVPTELGVLSGHAASVFTAATFRQMCWSIGLIALLPGMGMSRHMGLRMACLAASLRGLGLLTTHAPSWAPWSEATSDWLVLTGNFAFVLAALLALAELMPSVRGDAQTPTSSTPHP